MIELLQRFLFTTAEFAAGVGAILWQGFQHTGRWLMREEHVWHHRLRRFIAVEARIVGTRRKCRYLYRAVHYLLHRYRLLPRWRKIVETATIMALLLAPVTWREWQAHVEEDALYRRFYARFYAEYVQTVSEQQAAYYADHYASQYAEYYLSDAYRDALRAALPQPTAQLFEEARKAPRAIRNMAINRDGVLLIKHFEGLRLSPYRDIGGKVTVGYGHLLRPDEWFSRLTREQAEALLKQDIILAQAVVKRSVKVPLTRNEFSALVSLVFNIGGYRFEHSTLLRKLNGGDRDGAAEELLRWRHVDRTPVRGLARRRVAEHRLFHR